MDAHLPVVVPFVVVTLLASVVLDIISENVQKDNVPAAQD